MPATSKAAGSALASASASQGQRTQVRGHEPFAREPGLLLEAVLLDRKCRDSIALSTRRCEE